MRTSLSLSYSMIVLGLVFLQGYAPSHLHVGIRYQMVVAAPTPARAGRFSHPVKGPHQVPHAGYCVGPEIVLIQPESDTALTTNKITPQSMRCRCLLANAFLLNIQCVLPEKAPQKLDVRDQEDVREEVTFGQHSWARVFAQQYCVSMHKTLCLLAYLLFCASASVGRR